MEITLDTDAVNLTWMTDIHIAANPPGRRQDDYMRAILDKLEFVKALTEEVGGACLCGGDFFHVKRPASSSNSLGLLIQCIRVLFSFPHRRVFGAVGNHDIMYDDMGTLPHQPLGLLIAAGVYHNLNTGPVVFSNRDGSVRVQVETFPYADGEKTLERLLASGQRPPGITYRVAIIHAYGQPGNKGMMYAERKIGYNELGGLDFDFCLWGHDHSRHGAETVGGITHVNLGSLARAAFASDEVERPVVAVALSFGPDGVAYREEPVPVKPLELAFVAADKGVENAARADEVTEFFSEMDEAVEGLVSGEPRDVLAQLCPDNKELLDLVLQLCEL